MFIVEKGETLVLRLNEKVTAQQMAHLYDSFERLEAKTGVKFVLLEEVINPVAIQKA